jgi:hypothetical protein
MFSGLIDLYRTPAVQPFRSIALISAARRWREVESVGSTRISLMVTGRARTAGDGAKDDTIKTFAEIL